MNNKTKNRIILFGQQNLQNSMLVGYLNQNTESECQLESQPTWKCAWNADTRPLLILIDANLARIEQISNLLEQIYEQALDLRVAFYAVPQSHPDRKSTRLNSSHVRISYAVFCLKKKKNKNNKVLY